MVIDVKVLLLVIIVGLVYEVLFLSKGYFFLEYGYYNMFFFLLLFE